MASDPGAWTDGRKIRVGELFDLLAGAPEGLTLERIAEGLEVSASLARATVRDLRVVLGVDESVNVTATPLGHRRPWLYELVGDYERARPWLANRVGDLESRLETVEAVSGSIARGATEGTVEWKKARRINLTISGLRGQLVAIEQEGDSAPSTGSI